MVWQNGQTSYQNQIGQFQNLKKLLESNLEKIKGRQSELTKHASQLKINSKPLEIPENNDNQIRSTLVEILLEGLCWTEPKILDKKEAGYVSA